MMKFWTNFAKNGSPGKSSNNVDWIKYDSKEEGLNYLIIDKKKNLMMTKDSLSFEKLIQQLYSDRRLNNQEKCVVLLQMFTYVGEDLYDNFINNYPQKCDRDDSEKFLIENASFIEY